MTMKQASHHETIGAAFTITVHRQQRLAAVHFPQLTLIHVVEGHKRYHLAERSGQAGSGDVLVIQAGQTLDLTNMPAPAGRYLAHCLSIPSDSVRRAIQLQLQEAQTPFEHIRSPLLIDALDHALRSLDSSGDFPDALIAHRIQGVLLTLQQLGFQPRVARQATTSERLRALIGERPADRWRAEEAANLLHQSESTLRRRLSQEGTSFRDLLDAVRMELALGLLQCSSQSIAAIALDCGYASPSRFAARFKQRYGRHPSELRFDRQLPGLTESGAVLTG